MKKSTTGKKGNKLAKTLFSPVLALTFIIGWILYITQQPKQTNNKKLKN